MKIHPKFTMSHPLDVRRPLQPNAQINKAWKALNREANPPGYSETESLEPSILGSTILQARHLDDLLKMNPTNNPELSTDELESQLEYALLYNPGIKHDARRSLEVGVNGLTYVGKRGGGKLAIELVSDQLEAERTALREYIAELYGLDRDANSGFSSKLHITLPTAGEYEISSGSVSRVEESLPKSVTLYKPQFIQNHARRNS